MNLMENPVPVLEENGKMTESQITIAVDFVTELISLGVIALVPHGVLLMNVCTLFLIATPGQPNLWRCMANMKKGHQKIMCSSAQRTNSHGCTLELYHQSLMPPNYSLSSLMWMNSASSWA
jgi:hypothetical protein